MSNNPKFKFVTKIIIFPPPKKHKKKVSFNDTVLVYIYNQNCFNSSNNFILPTHFNTHQFQHYLYNHPPKYYSNNKWHNKNLDQLDC